MDSKSAPIGVFDSGVGGITAIKEIRKLMPGENVVYFGDTGRVPYGSKSRDIILKYAAQDISFLKSLKVKMIIAACGTVSSVIDIKSQNEELPFLGVVNPTCEEAVRLTKNKKVGVIGTQTTIKSRSYLKGITSFDKNIRVYQKDCPIFAPLIESGISNLPYEIIFGIVKENLKFFDGCGIDVLILGCTHYPIIEDIISDIMGNGVKLINSGKEVAKCAKSVLKAKNLESPNNLGGKYDFYVSDGAETFCETANRFLGYDMVKNVKKVNIDLY